MAGGVISFISDRGRVLGLSLAFLLPVAAASPKGLTTLFVVTALLLAWRSWQEKRKLNLPRGFWLFAAALLGYGALSLLWSVSLSDGIGKLGQLIGVLVGMAVLWDAALGLSWEEHKRMIPIMAFGSLVGLAFVAFEAWQHDPVGRFFMALGGASPEQLQSHAVSKALLKIAAPAAALAVWPTCVAFRRRWGGWAALGFMGLTFALLLWLLSDAAILAFLAGAMVYLPARHSPRFVARLSAAMVVILALATPALITRLPSPDDMVRAVPQISNSAHHRFTIWKFATERVFERPWFGWGLDSSRAIPGGKKIIQVDADIPGRAVPLRMTEELLPLHPHNAFLQLWLEFGIIGLLPLMALFARAPLWLAKTFCNAEERAAALSLFAGFVVISALSFGVWQSWWLALIGLASAFMLAARKRSIS